MLCWTVRRQINQRTGKIRRLNQRAFFKIAVHLLQRQPRRLALFLNLSLGLAVFRPCELLRDHDPFTLVIFCRPSERGIVMGLTTSPPTVRHWLLRKGCLAKLHLRQHPQTLKRNFLNPMFLCSLVSTDAPPGLCCSALGKKRAGLHLDLLVLPLLTGTHIRDFARSKL